MITKEGLAECMGLVFLHNPERLEGKSDWTSRLDILDNKWVTVCYDKACDVFFTDDDPYSTWCLDPEWLFYYDVRENTGDTTTKEVKVSGTYTGSVIEGDQVMRKTANPTPVVSDGGSSAYYKVVLPLWLLKKQEENGYIMIEDLAEIMYNNDFNYSNVLKAQKRMFSLEQGSGKAGNSMDYDATKCKYSIDKQLEKFNR